MCLEHCSSLREVTEPSGQSARAHARQALLFPWQPRAVRQTLFLVWRPSEPQEREQGDQGDHGDQEPGARITECTAPEAEIEITPSSPSSQHSSHES